MTVLLAAVLVAAAVLLFRPPGGAAVRFRRASGGRRGSAGLAVPAARGSSAVRSSALRRFGPGRLAMSRAAQQQAGCMLTLMVHQLAALLKGGRTPARLWDELWLVHAGRAVPGPGPGSGLGPGPASGRQPGLDRATTETGWPANPSSRSADGSERAGLSAGSLTMLGSVRAAAFRGSPVSGAIRGAVRAAFPRRGGREARIWCELAACFDIAEASGCPLADVLARFAAQLEVEDDAEAAIQTALAGPKATVRLLTWLPLMGLGLGMALGVDPLAMLIGTPPGTAALAAGTALTVAGRIWSARLVRAAGTGA